MFAYLYVWAILLPQHLAWHCNFCVLRYL